MPFCRILSINIVCVSSSQFSVPTKSCLKQLPLYYKRKYASANHLSWKVKPSIKDLVQSGIEHWDDGVVVNWNEWSSDVDRQSDCIRY